MAEIKHAYLKQAKVQAFREPVLSFVGGVVFDNPEDPAVSPLRHSRYRKPCDAAAQDADYSAYLPGRFIYGGPVYHHFGHFVAEMMHRIIPGRQLQPDWPLLFVAPLGSGEAATIPDYISAVLDFFGLHGENLRIINKDTIVEELLVVEAGSDFGGGPKPGYTDLLAQFTPARLAELAPDQATAERIYVSRSRIPHGGSFLGEKYLEQWLATAGFRSIFPEELPYANQVKAYASAQTVIFAEGSACHGAEVLGSAAIQNCLLVGRRQNHMHIFMDVLRARSKAFRGLVCGPDLGTAVGRTGSHEPLPNFGVSLLDRAVIVQLLTSGNVLPDTPFDVEAYLAAAESELHAYLAYHKNRPSPLFEPCFSDALLARFDAAVKDYGAPISHPGG